MKQLMVRYSTTKNSKFRIQTFDLYGIARIVQLPKDFLNLDPVYAFFINHYFEEKRPMILITKQPQELAIAGLATKRMVQWISNENNKERFSEGNIIFEKVSKKEEIEILRKPLNFMARFYTFPYQYD